MQRWKRPGTRGQCPINALAHNYKLKHFINLHGGMDYGHMAKEFIRNASLTTIYNILHVKPCPNGKCLATKRDETLFGDKTFSRLDTLFGVVGSCLIVFGCV